VSHFGLAGQRVHIMLDKITKDSTLTEICKRPGAREILAKYHCPCLHCPMASLEMGSLKIGEICQMYNLDIDNLLKELNKD